MSITKPIARFEATLVNEIDENSTTLELDTISTPAGNLASGLYGISIEEESSSKREYAIGTLSGTTFTFTKRDVDPRDGDTIDSSADTNRKKHRKGSSIKITSFPTLMEIQQVLSGAGGIDPATPVNYSSEPTLTARAEVATVGYVLDNVNGGGTGIIPAGA